MGLLYVLCRLAVTAELNGVNELESEGTGRIVFEVDVRQHHKDIQIRRKKAKVR
jgi:hypothetical protein